jgi:hypothetical protein
MVGKKSRKKSRTGTTRNKDTFSDDVDELVLSEEETEKRSQKWREKGAELFTLINFAHAGVESASWPPD